MRDLPIVFPISLVVILIAIFFTAAYAISEDALSEASPAYAKFSPSYTRQCLPMAVTRTKMA